MLSEVDDLLFTLKKETRVIIFYIHYTFTVSSLKHITQKFFPPSTGFVVIFRHCFFPYSLFISPISSKPPYEEPSLHKINYSLIFIGKTYFKSIDALVY